MIKILEIILIKDDNMNLTHINPKNPDKDKIKRFIEILRDGGVIVYPTDTVYGIGANIFNEDAVRRVYSIKKREYGKPISVCVSSVDEIDKIAFLDLSSKRFIEKILPGPFTVILDRKDHVPDILTAGSKKIGVRIPNSPLCMELSREFPITTTSANLSGGKVLESVDDILRELGEAVDVVIDAGPIRKAQPSTVIDLTGSKPKILRKGSDLPF